MWNKVKTIDERKENKMKVYAVTYNNPNGDFFVRELYSNEKAANEDALRMNRQIAINADCGIFEVEVFVVKEEVETLV